jgi:hypothetical protein
MELYIKTKEGISKDNFVKIIESNKSFINAIDCEIHSSENLFNEFKNIVLGQKVRRIENVNGFDRVVNFSKYEQLVTEGKLESEGSKYIQNEKNKLSNRYYFTDHIIDFSFFISYIDSEKSIFIILDNSFSFNPIAICHSLAVKLNAELYFYLNNSDKVIITASYLEALRIKEENRRIKLTKEQNHVLEYIDDQCRWWYLPTDDVPKILNILGIQPNIKEGDITSIIDDIQREIKVAIAIFTGHTIIFGFNAPYISYSDLQTYLAEETQQTPHLQDILNKLSKAFGTAAYFEYNNDDELIASLAWSSKGKFVYGRFTSEGEGIDIFGTQKKTMDVNQKTIIKTAKKLGMTPEDILTGIMKQKMPVRYFVQPHWYIESRLSRKH